MRFAFTLGTPFFALDPTLRDFVTFLITLVAFSLKTLRFYLRFDKHHNVFVISGVATLFIFFVISQLDTEFTEGYRFFSLYDHGWERFVAYR